MAELVVPSERLHSTYARAAVHASFLATKSYRGRLQLHAVAPAALELGASGAPVLAPVFEESASSFDVCPPHATISAESTARL